jgi:uncharacterized membrane protein YbhN (UPF0104 family)
VVVQSPPVDGVGDDGPPEAAPVGSPVAGGKQPAGHWTRGRVIRRSVEAVVLVGAALFLLRRVGHLGEVAGAFDHLHWHWLFLAVAAEASSVVALSWVQQKLLGVGKLPVGVKDLVPVTLASNAVSLSLPAGTLFAEGYTFRQYQWLGASQVLAIWSQLSAGALATAALAAVAVAGAAAAPGLRVELLPVLTFVLAGALVAAALFRRAPLLGALIGRLLRGAERFLPASVSRHLLSAQVALRQMNDFNPPPRLWLACFGVAALNWVLDSVVLIMGLLTVGAPVPWKGILISYAAAQVLVELPITPGGLGLVEGGLVEVLIRFHVPASLATAGTLVYRAVSYWLLLLVGWSAALYLTLRNRRATRAAAAATTRPA